MPLDNVWLQEAIQQVNVNWGVDVAPAAPQGVPVEAVDPAVPERREPNSMWLVDAPDARPGRPEWQVMRADDRGYAYIFMYLYKDEAGKLANLVLAALAKEALAGTGTG